MPPVIQSSATGGASRSVHDEMDVYVWNYSKEGLILFLIISNR